MQYVVIDPLIDKHVSYHRQQDKATKSAYSYLSQVRYEFPAGDLPCPYVIICEMAGGIVGRYLNIVRHPDFILNLECNE